MSKSSHLKLAPVGHCIYCEAAGVPLTDEHVIPLALNGNVILPKASCEVCQRETSAFERICARDSLGAFRQRFGFDTRRPKRRTNTLALSFVDSSGTARETTVPVMDHPAFLTMPVVKGPPSIMVGLPATEDLIDSWTYVTNPEVLKATPAGSRVGGTVFHPMSVFRMLAKIAHCHAFAEGAFDKYLPILTDFILGRSQTPTYYIGCIGEQPGAEPQILHHVSLYDASGPVEMLVVKIRLFAQFGAPEYVVVAGLR